MNQMMHDGGLNAAQVLGVGSGSGMPGVQAVIDSDEDGVGEAVSMEQAAGRRGKSKKAKKKVGNVSGSGGQMMG